MNRPYPECSEPNNTQRVRAIHESLLCLNSNRAVWKPGERWIIQPSTAALNGASLPRLNFTSVQAFAEVCDSLQRQKKDESAALELVAQLGHHDKVGYLAWTVRLIRRPE